MGDVAATEYSVVSTVDPPASQTAKLVPTYGFFAKTIIENKLSKNS
jgi:hypothetical protein